MNQILKSAIIAIIAIILASLFTGTLGYFIEPGYTWIVCFLTAAAVLSGLAIFFISSIYLLIWLNKTL